MEHQRTNQMAKAIIFTKIPQQPYKKYTPVFYTEGCMKGFNGKQIAVEDNDSVYVFAINARVPVTTTLRCLPSIRASDNPKSGSLLLSEKVNGHPLMRSITLTPGKLDILSFTWGVEGSTCKQTDCIDGVLFRTFAPFVTGTDKLVICGLDGNLGMLNANNGKVMSPIGLGSYIAHTNLENKHKIEYKLAHITVDYYDYNQHKHNSSKQIKEKTNWEPTPYSNKIYNSSQNGLRVIIKTFGKDATLDIEVDKISEQIDFTKPQNLHFDRQALASMGTLPRTYEKFPMGDVLMGSGTCAYTEAIQEQCKPKYKFLNNEYLVSMDTLSKTHDGKPNGNPIPTVTEQSIQSTNGDTTFMLDKQSDIPKTDRLLTDIPQSEPREQKPICVKGLRIKYRKTPDSSAVKSSLDLFGSNPLDGFETKDKKPKVILDVIRSDTAIDGLQRHHRVRPLRSFRKWLNRFFNKA